MPSAFDFLVASQNHDGGWGYKRLGISYVEPTSAVLLAIQNDPRAAEPVARGREYLQQLQHADGGWGIAGIDAESGWMTGWAVWALASASPMAAARGVEWLLHTEGPRSTDPTELAQARQVLGIDLSLSGWPWQVGDASWVFPTALALLALAATGHSSHPRAAEGIRYLLDRAVMTGGWNFGTPFMITGELSATVLDTALVLIALKQAGFHDQAVARAQAELSRRLDRARTSAELAWGIWAMRTTGLDTAAWVAHLQDLQRPDGSWDTNPLTTAVALLT